MVAKELPFEAACTINLHDSDYTDDSSTKVAYNSALVDLLIDEVYLEFFGGDQITYHTITIEELTDGTVVALLRLYYVEEDEDVDEDED